MKWPGPAGRPTGTHRGRALRTARPELRERSPSQRLISIGPVVKANPGPVFRSAGGTPSAPKGPDASALVAGLGRVQRAARATVSGRIGAGRPDAPDRYASTAAAAARPSAMAHT